MNKPLLTKKIERPAENIPESTFDRSTLFTPRPEKKTAAKKSTTSTTIRLSHSNQDKLNALLIINQYTSIDQLLDAILDVYEATLDANQKKEMKIIEKSLSGRRNKKK